MGLVLLTEGMSVYDGLRRVLRSGSSTIFAYVVYLVLN